MMRISAASTSSSSALRGATAARAFTLRGLHAFSALPLRDSGESATVALAARAESACRGRPSTDGLPTLVIGPPGWREVAWHFSVFEVGDDMRRPWLSVA